MKQKKPKILIIDIETRPAVAYVWRMWKENIAPEQLIDEGGTICFCAHWFGTKEYVFFSDWDHGHKRVIKEAHKLITEADAVVTYNGDRFDLPKLQGEFLRTGLTPPPPPTSIDVLKTVKKLGFVMNRLAYIGPLLNVGAKVKHEGFNLWKSVLAGDPKAQAKMKKYCIQDVRMLRNLYVAIRPYIKNHPHMADQGAHTCGACGSKHVQKRGVRRTKTFSIQRLQCQACGAWQDGSRAKIKDAATKR